MQMFYGVAAEDKEVDSPTLKVFCPQLTPFTESPTIEDTQVTFSLKQNGRKNTNSVQSSVTLICEFLGQPYNFSIPDVHKGEGVIVLGLLGGMKNLYWWPIATDISKLRLQEHFHIRCENKTEDRQNQTDDEQVYDFEINTKTKHRIRIHTGGDNEYTLILDEDNNKCQLSDKLGNIIKIDSTKGLIDINAMSKLSLNAPIIELNGDNLTANITDEIAITGGLSVTISGATTFTNFVTFNGGTTGDRV